jgi:hypothetical protein
MDEFGVDRSLMFPTLASLVEERLRDDIEATHAVIHALNEWMYETWTFDYENRIFATPVITLPNLDKAIEELQWCVERGAKTVLIRPAPVPLATGRSTSPGLPQFDRSGRPSDRHPRSMHRPTAATPAARTGRAAEVPAVWPSAWLRRWPIAPSRTRSPRHGAPRSRACDHVRRERQRFVRPLPHSLAESTG